MKNAINVRTFAAAVKAKVAAADAIGSKTSWDTADHLKALAQALAAQEIPAGVAPEAAFLEILEDGYNMSAFQVVLAKAYTGKGHFTRKGGKTTMPSALYTALGIT